MQFPLLRSACAIFVTLVFLVHSADAGESAFTPRELALLKMSHSTVRVAVDEAVLHAAPDADSPSAWTARWVDTLTVDSRRLSSAPAGWIPIKGTDEKLAAKGGNVVPESWVRRSDVVFGDDYKKVIGCWPVESASFVEGEYEIEFAFKPDGSAMASELCDIQVCNRPPHRSHVYMARNVVSVEATSKKDGFMFAFGYRPEERKLSSTDEQPGELEEQKPFPDAVLKDCKSVPTLAKSRTQQNRTLRP